MQRQQCGNCGPMMNANHAAAAISCAAFSFALCFVDFFAATSAPFQGGDISGGAQAGAPWDCVD